MRMAYAKCVSSIHGGGEPLPFERALDPADVIGRDEETARLVELAVARRMVSLAAPRRYGKERPAGAGWTA